MSALLLPDEAAQDGRGGAAGAASAPPRGSGHPDDVPSDVTEAVEAVCRAAREAARASATATGALRAQALHAISRDLVAATAEIVAANAVDVDRERAEGMSEALLDRLRLDPDRVRHIADAVTVVAGLTDPVGQVVRGYTLPNGLRVQQVRRPLGVVGMVYEARPNVTVDAAALTLRSGNAVVLRGGSAALETNRVLVDVLREAVASTGLPRELVATIDAHGRAGVRALLRARGLVDLVVPRGGRDLIDTVVRTATVPTIETGAGVVHVYVDAAADLEQAVGVVVNAKASRPSVCNAAETLLVHSAVAGRFLPMVLPALAAAGVTVHGDERTRAVAGAHPVVHAGEEDWAAEYHSLDLAVRVVADLDEAVSHIDRWSTGHTEAILSTDTRAVSDFVARVDSAAIMVNASTRFTDGEQLGLGAEIGISTQKLHARGPMGLPELTTTTWIVTGDGQVRG